MKVEFIMEVNAGCCCMGMEHLIYRGLPYEMATSYIVTVEIDTKSEDP